MGLAKREAERAEQRRRKNVVLRKRGIRVPAEAKRPELRIRLRVYLVCVIDRVAAEQAIGRRKDVVHAGLAIIVPGRLRERVRELVSRQIRRRKQIQYRPHDRGHRQRLSCGQGGNAAPVNDVVGGVASCRHHI